MQRNVQEAILAATGRYVRKLFVDVDLRVKALEARPVPETERSVSAEEMRPLIADMVDERIKALSPPAAKDLDAADLASFAENFVRRLDEAFTQ